jgi:hypothetical protein
MPAHWRRNRRAHAAKAVCRIASGTSGGLKDCDGRWKPRWAGWLWLRRLQLGPSPKVGFGAL